MKPHRMLDGNCKHGNSNFCEECDRASYPERYQGATLIPNGRTCGDCQFYIKWCHKLGIIDSANCRTCDYDPCRYNDFTSASPSKNVEGKE